MHTQPDEPSQRAGETNWSTLHEGQPAPNGRQMPICLMACFVASLACFLCRADRSLQPGPGEEQFAPLPLFLHFGGGNVDTGRWMPGISLVLSTRGSYLFERQTCRHDPVAEGKGQC